MRLLVILAIALCCRMAAARESDRIDLAGEWSVAPGDGIEGGAIRLPSTLDMAGYGEVTDTAALSTDERFRRLTRRRSYIGPATYTRRVTITKQMAGRPLELNIGRVIWKSRAKIGGKDFDNQEYSLVAPHRHILKEGMPAGDYLLEVEIDNSRQYDISSDNLAHSYTNDTQTMWNGMLGEISLRALPAVDLARVEIYPTGALDSVRVEAFVDNTTSRNRKEKIRFSIPGAESTAKATLTPGRNRVSVTLPAAGLEKWNEFHPTLHRLTVQTAGESAAFDFGMRTVDNRDGLRINGTPVFLRGTLECCVFPLTGTPPTDNEGWLKTFTSAREWGLNHLRFHSWCPPDAAFRVADSIGFYLQVELPVWSLKIGDDPEAERFLRDEFERIVENYGNHPSLCLLSVGNELQHDFNWLNETVRKMKARDPRHLYTTTSFTFERGHGGHPEPEDEFLVTQWTDSGWVRGQGVFETERPAFDKDYSRSMTGINVPLISHEIGQYAVYPRMAEIDKYTGVLDPLNFKQIRDDLKTKGLLDESARMTEASGHLAAILYKEEIERAMKTGGMSGFQLLGLQDFPGQGTALVGLVDAFWDSKGAVDAGWFREFCSPVVPLLDFRSAVYASTDTFDARARVANFSDTPLSAGDISWSLTAGDRTLSSGTIPFGGMEPGALAEAGRFSVSLSAIKEPTPVTVRLRLADGQENSWRIHVYPEPAINEGAAVVTRSPAEAIAALEAGRRVLLAPAPDSIAGLPSRFLPVFWSPVHFPKQAGTMGIMCDPEHPALAGFPNDGHSDWQWWTAARNARTIDMDSVAGATPIVRVIDNFVHNRRLAYIFEATCGNGKLLFSAVDILNPDIDSPDMKALRASVINYVNSPTFNPGGSVTADELDRLVRHD